jgi:glycosyltransferase involved in cell wall biosynthesis
MSLPMPSPKILHLVWTFNPAGAERIAQAILERCVREGFEAHACALSGSEVAAKEEWRDKGIRLHDVRKGRGFDFTLPFRLRRVLVREGISHLHTHNAVSGFYGAWALVPGIRHVHTEHSNIGRERRLLRLLRLRQLRSASVVAVSRKVATTFSRTGGFAPSKIRLIYNGVRLQAPGSDSRERVLRDLGIPANARLVGTIGNLRPVKDHRTLLRAFAPIAGEMEEAHLLIVGEGDERVPLEAEIHRLGLAGRVSLPGFRSDVADLLGSMAVFVLSSRSEGLPVSLLEAMSAGCPVVSTAVGGVPEIIAEGENGLLVPAGSAEALTRSIRFLLSSPGESARLARRARETVSERFDEERMLQDYVSLYREAP